VIIHENKEGIIRVADNIDDTPGLKSGLGDNQV
jgi:hypothetical protein